MKTTHCPNEMELILHYYGELPENGDQARHLAACPLCENRLAALKQDLDRLPQMAHETDEMAGVRMAARVSEHVQRRRGYRLPALGISMAATFALVIALTFWLPTPGTVQPEQPRAQRMASLDLNDVVPDIEFLEDLELIKHLDLLRQLEGV